MQIYVLEGRYPDSLLAQAVIGVFTTPTKALAYIREKDIKEAALAAWTIDGPEFGYTVRLNWPEES